MASSNDQDHREIITLINNLTDAVFSLDRHGVVQLYNSAALDLLDTNHSVVGQPIDTVLTLQRRGKRHLSIIDELTSSTQIRKTDDIIMRLDDKDFLRLEVTFAPVQRGGKQVVDGYVLIIRDITKAKSLEEERDEFISTVSHELRTPITIAEGALSNAQLLASRNEPDAIATALATAHQQILFLAKMVNDLSTLSRAERGLSPELESIDLNTLLSDLTTEYAPQAQQKSLDFQVVANAPLTPITTSRLYLQEILQNLLTNALKYTPTGSVTLRVHQRSDQTSFAIIDTGIGISRSDSTKVFDRFYRAEDYRTRQTSGTGLGLYIASKLARKLGTNITIKSRLNHGSTFGFVLKHQPIDQ